MNTKILMSLPGVALSTAAICLGMSIRVIAADTTSPVAPSYQLIAYGQQQQQHCSYKQVHHAAYSTTGSNGRRVYHPAYNSEQKVCSNSNRAR